MRNTCLNQIYELAKKDPRIVFIGSDLRLGTLQQFKDEFPDRYFMEGINEQNIIGMAAGLAMEGYIPYVNTIATFLTRRCYEQIALDVCLHNLPVRLVANGAGLAYGPLGPTHTAIEDISLMRHLPNMAVICPSDAEEIKQLMPQTLDYPQPMYIRLGKGNEPIIEYEEDSYFMINVPRRVKGNWKKSSYDYLIISTGLTTDIAIKTKLLLQKKGIHAEVLHVHTIKPFRHMSASIFDSISRAHKGVIIIEEHLRWGGLGSAIIERLPYNQVNCQSNGNRILVKRFGIPDNFIKQYGTWNELMDICGLTPEKIVELL